MHMPGFKTCSGERGDARVNLIPYVLAHNISHDAVQYAVESWSPAQYDTVALPSTHWLRTSDPADLSSIRLSAEFHAADFRSRGDFAFLGGDRGAADTSYAGVVGRSQASFLRCSSIELCGPPEYTFAGRTVDRSRFHGDRRRRSGGGSVQPLTTDDFVLCGSLGFRRELSRVDGAPVFDDREYQFDIDLFPHVCLLVSASGETSAPYCNELFGDPVGASSRADDVAGIQLVSDVSDPCDIGALCCQGASEADVQCKYVGIGTASGLTPIAVFEALVGKVNNIHRLLTVPPSMFAQRKSTRGLSILVECVNEISRVNAEYQAPLRGAYGTDTEAGLYHALTYHLFEFPVLWYYKWVYTTLIWPVDTSALRIALKANDWLGVIDTGEAWHSRASTRQGTPRRCDTPSCVCQPSAGVQRTGAMRDSLLCFNGGTRLRLESGVAAAAGTGRRRETVLAEDTVSQYTASMKQKVLAETLDFVKREFDIDPTKPETFLGGCHTRVRWNEEVCLADPVCKAHLLAIARGKGVDPAAFNPLDDAYAAYFVFEGFQLSDATPNLLDVVLDLVDSYEFADGEFDALDEGALLRGNETTRDGETKWFYPLFRFRGDAVVTDEHDEISDDDEGRVFLVPPDPALLATSVTAKCISAPDGTPEVFADAVTPPPTAAFSADPAGADPVFVDVCADPNAERSVFPDNSTVMSCSFQPSMRTHGSDICDYWAETSCDLRDVVVKSVEKHGSWLRLRAHFRCTEKGLHEFPNASAAPAMKCRRSPLHNSRCKNFRSGATYVGSWAPYARGRPQDYHLEFDLTASEYKRFSKLTDGFTNNELQFLGTNGQRVWMYHFGVRGQVIKALRMTNYRKHTRQDDWWAHHIIADGCPLRDAEVPLYYGSRVVGQVLTYDMFPRPDSHFQPADTFPSEQLLHSMCHRVTSACFSPRDPFASPLYTSARKCNLQYARLPPGVAARFYVPRDNTLRPHDNAPHGGYPTWAWCPHNPPPDPAAAVGGHVLHSDYDIPVPKKAMPQYYPGIPEPAFETCTEQLVDCERTRCTNGPVSEEGCFIFDPGYNTEWYFSRTKAECKNKGHHGACSFSLTLARHYFCGAGSGDFGDPMSYTPPDHECPTDMDKILVRGKPNGTRSLWKCGTCSKYEPVAASSLAKCGFRPVNQTGSGSAARRSIRRSGWVQSDAGMLFSRDVVAAVKQFITQDVHSIDHLEALHTKFNVPFHAGGGDVRFSRATATAYTSLHDLQAAHDYEKWEGYRDGGCASAVNDADPTENTCMWPGRYDITRMLEKDEFYRSRPANLQCASKTPRAAEYKRCSPESDAQRTQLREWVDANYRKGLGTWLPVLPPARGIAWKLDRSATRHPFTLFFAAHHRPESQVHARNVLGEAICRQGSRLHSICASLTRSGKAEYYLANPWPAGEFNVFMPDDPQDTLDAMGLAQCLRPGGRWEMCCSCTPAELCCFPDQLCAADSEPEPHEDNHFTRQGHSAACQPNAGRYDRGQPIPVDHPTNICLRDPIQHLPAVCSHHQGIVGAPAGAPVSTLAALYHETAASDQSRAPRVEDFLVDPHPVLWAGKTAAEADDYQSGRHRVLRMPDELLYPAHLVASAGRAGTLLRMHAAQMQRNNNDGSDALFWNARLIGLREWVQLLHGEMAHDADLAVRLYPGLLYYDPAGGGGDPVDDMPPAPEWHCPLRAAAFWGRDIRGFNPIVPDPTRADAMFRGTYYCRPDDATCLHGVHPYVESREYRGARDYFSPDGRCYFDVENGDDPGAVATLQRREMHTSLHACGFLAQAAFVASGQWESSRVVASARGECDDILDWPHQPLRYHSGESNVRGTPGTTVPHKQQSCALLPRLAPFRIRILSDAPLVRSTKASTSDEGGDCHMGRATRIKASEHDQLRQYEHCITVGRTATQAHVRCTGERIGGRASAADRLFTFSRERRLHPVHDVLHAPTHPQRAQCGQCDAASVPFVTSKGAERREAETSSGVTVPVRFSGIRLLARELARMCDRDENCRMDDAAWTTSAGDTTAFLRTLLTAPAELLSRAADAAAGGSDPASSR